MPERVLAALRRVNRAVALAVGAGLLATAAFVLADILLRRLGASFGGTDEISGYAMAIATSWGMAYTLLELGHVRIDVLRGRLPAWPRVLLDLVAMGVLALTATLIAWQCWPVLASSLANDATANTPLETPLALVQIPWVAGWVWFALTAWITLAAAAALLLTGRRGAAEAAIGALREEEALR